jgi:hypothetical protein
MPTWLRTQAIYEERSSHVVQRYGKQIADRMRTQVHRIPSILARYELVPILHERAAVWYQEQTDPVSALGPCISST